MLDSTDAYLYSEVLGVEQRSNTEMILLMQWEYSEGLVDALVTIKNIDGN